MISALSCNDSDDKNYYKFGYVIGSWPGDSTQDTEYDSCCSDCYGQRRPIQTSDNLIEFYCNNSEISFEIYQCDCSGGICLQTCSEQNGIICPGYKCKGEHVPTSDLVDGCCIGTCENGSIPSNTCDISNVSQCDKSCTKNSDCIPNGPCGNCYNKDVNFTNIHSNQYNFKSIKIILYP